MGKQERKGRREGEGVTLREGIDTSSKGRPRLFVACSLVASAPFPVRPTNVLPTTARAREIAYHYHFPSLPTLLTSLSSMFRVRLSDSTVVVGREMEKRSQKKVREAKGGKEGGVEM